VWPRYGVQLKRSARSRADNRSDNGPFRSASHYRAGGNEMNLSRRTFAKMGIAGTVAVGAAGLLRPPARSDTPPSGMPVAAIRARSVVLVHGLYADGSSWIDVVPYLQAAGLNVAVVQNPLSTLTDAAAETRRVCRSNPVRWSWAGILGRELWSVRWDRAVGQCARLHRRSGARRARGLSGAVQAVPDASGVRGCRRITRRIRRTRRGNVSPRFRRRRSSRTSPRALCRSRTQSQHPAR